MDSANKVILLKDVHFSTSLLASINENSVDPFEYWVREKMHFIWQILLDGTDGSSNMTRAIIFLNFRFQIFSKLRAPA